MEPQNIIIALNGIIMAGGGFFIAAWVKRVDATLEKLWSSKLDKEDFGSYKVYSREFRAERDKEITTIRNRVDQHRHSLTCSDKECNIKTNGVLI